MINQNPEQIARDEIDAMLIQAGWQVQSKNKVSKRKRNRSRLVESMF